MWNWSQLILVSETERHYAPVVTNTAPTDLMANVKKRKRCTQSIIWLHTFSYEEEEEGKKRRKKLQFVLPLGSHRINVIKLTFIPQKWLHQLFFSHNFEHQTQICTEHCPQVMRGTTGNERHQWGDVTDTSDSVNRRNSKIMNYQYHCISLCIHRGKLFAEHPPVENNVSNCLVSTARAWSLWSSSWSST